MIERISSASPRERAYQPGCYAARTCVVLLLWIGIGIGNSFGDIANPGWRERDHVSPEKLADRAWDEVNMGGHSPQRHKDEDQLAYFMRCVEAADMHRREAGLRFWNAFPGDARRYQWLVMTVHLPPHYPLVIDEWANNETSPGINKAGIDISAKAKWDAQYAALRNEFWNAPVVTEQQRRYLRYGELLQEIRQMSEASARGEIVVPDNLLRDILDYSKKYRHPLSESDVYEHHRFNQSLIEEIFKAKPLLRIDDRELESFIASQAASGNENSMAMADGYQARFRADAETETRKDLERFDNHGDWQLLPAYPLNQPTTLEGETVARHQQMVMRRKFREMGMRLWQRTAVRRERMQWLTMTLRIAPYYVTDVNRGIGLLVANRESALPLDHEAVAKWDEIYPSLRAALWNDKATTDRERSDLLYSELVGKLWRIRSNQEAKDGMQAVISGIYELYAKYGRPRSAYSCATIVFQHASSLGMSDADLRALLKPMIACKFEKLRAFAEGRFRFLDLRERGISLVAPTIQGHEFDLESLRGKIVLVDFWATTCASCVEAMPRIKRVYEHYRGYGFEVVSVCFDGLKNRRRVERLHDEMEITWPTLVADTIVSEIATRYGFSTVPEYLLLDRGGRLVATSSEIDMGRNLETLLKEMLSQENRIP